MADRILVSTAEMNLTITKFEQARTTLQDAFASLDKAKEHLDRCYKGAAYLVLAMKYADICNNARTAERAIDKSVTGLRNTINQMDTAEGGASSTATSTNTGKSAPTYL